MLYDDTDTLRSVSLECFHPLQMNSVGTVSFFSYFSLSRSLLPEMSISFVRFSPAGTIRVRHWSQNLSDVLNALLISHLEESLTYTL